jgi:hypothetical protein
MLKMILEMFTTQIKDSINGQTLMRTMLEDIKSGLKLKDQTGRINTSQTTKIQEEDMEW